MTGFFVAGIVMHSNILDPNRQVLMLYKEFKPSNPLPPFIKCLWMLENDASGERTMEKVLPDASAELIIHYGDRFCIKDKNGIIRVQPRSFVFGPLTKHIEIGPTGQTGIIAARFYPGGAACFLPVPVKTLTNTYVSLRTLFGKKGSNLEKNICGAPGLEERKAVLESFLQDRLPAKQTFNTLIPADLNNLITSKTTPVKIESLSRELNVGRRQLERKFSNEAGMSPKMLVKIIRFQNIFKILDKNTPDSLTSLTYEAGYYDQSHFNRDFRAFTGVSPKEYFRENAMLNRLFTLGS